MQKRLINIFTLLTVAFWCNYSVAQINGDKPKYRIGIGLPVISLFPNTDPIIPSACIIFKWGKDKNIFRSGISNSVFAQYSQTLFNVGYERRWIDRKFQLFTGADISYMSTYIIYETTLGRYKETLKAFGAGPVIGAGYNISDKLMLETEVGLLAQLGKTNGFQDRWGGGYFTTHRFFSVILSYKF